MPLFENIAEYKSMEEWREAYKEKSGGYPPPAPLCVEMAKAMKKHKLSWTELAQIIDKTGKLPD